MISVRLNLGVARELERFQSGSRLSKNLIINRGTRLYIQLLRMAAEDGIDVLSLIDKQEFKQLIREMIINKNVYWRL